MPRAEVDVQKPIFARASGAPAFAYVAAVLMVGAALAAPAMWPQAAPTAIDLEHALPVAFGDWRVDPDEMPI